MAIDWLAPSVLAAVVGAVSGLATNYLAESRRRRYDDKVKQADRLRDCAVDLCDAATEVGAGEDSHDKVRARYAELYLLTSSAATLTAARQLVRTSWNVSEQLAGRPRRRPAPAGIPPSKEIREMEFAFLDQVRKEIGVAYKLPHLEAPESTVKDSEGTVEDGPSPALPATGVQQA